MPINITMVSILDKSAKSNSSGLWQETTTKCRDNSLWVIGMPTAAGADNALVTPAHRSAQREWDQYPFRWQHRNNQKTYLRNPSMCPGPGWVPLTASVSCEPARRSLHQLLDGILPLTNGVVRGWDGCFSRFFFRYPQGQDSMRVCAAAVFGSTGGGGGFEVWVGVLCPVNALGYTHPPLRW